jgi:hypothetical protein
MMAYRNKRVVIPARVKTVVVPKTDTTTLRSGG